MAKGHDVNIKPPIQHALQFPLMDSRLQIILLRYEEVTIKTCYKRTNHEDVKKMKNKKIVDS